MIEKLPFKIDFPIDKTNRISTSRTRLFYKSRSGSEMPKKKKKICCVRAIPDLNCVMRVLLGVSLSALLPCGVESVWPWRPIRKQRSQHALRPIQLLAPLFLCAPCGFWTLLENKALSSLDDWFGNSSCGFNRHNPKWAIKVKEERFR